MTNQTNDLSTVKTQEIEKPTNEHSQFTKRITRLNAISCNSFNSKDFDLHEMQRESEEGLKALNTKEGLNEMLAAQMLSVHRLQQISTAMANENIHISSKQYFSNTAIKLANTFVQQANLLSRLQGTGGQRITVERVNVHNGGQAIVGNINGVSPGKVKK